MKHVNWSEVLRSHLRALESWDPDAWLLTVLAIAILALTAVELIGGRSPRWPLLIILNIAFAGLAVLSLGSYVAYHTLWDRPDFLQMSHQERLAMMFTYGLAYHMPVFYVSWFFLILLALTSLRRRRVGRSQTAAIEADDS